MLPFKVLFFLFNALCRAFFCAFSARIVVRGIFCAKALRVFCILNVYFPDFCFGFFFYLLNSELSFQVQGF